ncbi:GntR family transcriptional regulator [Mesorhizobium sp. B2-6-5]|uniref:GntR family transcriptional regulator n=1 Tax=Mesorhizobium sp. B2-6-5 TaxID=2589912 RepID=UPI0015E383F8|nr:GntR family transcriptional regulator [Mesorhizobium sp. B2-6-5]
MLDIETVRNGTQGALGSAVYGRLKADILSLRIEPRAVLQEIELGERYGVSRTPVREALRHLLDEGLIERNGRFYQVTELTRDDIRDLYEVREALETTAVRLCIERSDEDAMVKLSAIVDQQADALARDDIAGFSALDSTFHLTIAAASQNAFLLRQLTSTHDKVRLARGREVAKPGWVERVIVEHRRILSALYRRDAAVADAEMRYHINSVVRLHLGLPQQPIGMLD